MKFAFGRLSGIALIVAGVPLTFLVVNYLHFEFLPVRVILYACILDSVIASALVGGAVYIFARKALDRIDTTLAFVLANALVAIYAIMGPTVIDRSLSLYIVEDVEQHGGTVSQAAMHDIFVREYLPEFRVVDLRITEQLQSGTLRLDHGCLRITPRGQALAAFVRWYRSVLLPRRRVMLGVETDALRHPFAHTTPVVDARCAVNPPSR
jgi:hypothetical protein